MTIAATPTHKVATWLLSTIEGLLNHLGLENHHLVERVIYIIVISLISFCIGLVIKEIILFLTHKILSRRQTPLTQELINRKVFTRCSHIIPPIVFIALLPFAFTHGSPVYHWISKIALVYILITFAIGINAVLRFAFDRYNQRVNRKNLPLNGIINIAVGTVWIVITILSICVIINKSPATLLAGLGAFAAALMLIFKDSILGFVAGIQMSDNDMLHVGDWIVVPGTPANGTVMDVSLSTVKIQNWDLTTVMVPPFTLVSGSFQNYRSMYEANARRIENSFIIDIHSVKKIDNQTIDNIVAKYPILKNFVDTLRQKGETAANIPDQRAINGTLETNLGLFRAYISQYLCNNPGISTEQRVMVRIMQGSNAGIPLQIWCFTSSTNWDEYQSVQSQTMEHISAVAPDFDGLTIYAANALSIDNNLPNYNQNVNPASQTIAKSNQ